MDSIPTYVVANAPITPPLRRLSRDASSRFFENGAEEFDDDLGRLVIYTVKAYS